MIRKLVLGGAVAGSAFTAGALPGANGTYGDGDDTLAGGAASGIGAVVAKNTVDPATRFVAGVFGTAKITGARVVPTADQRFLLLA
jgi:hypothetical protein